jgi:hypothetical protein
MEKIIPAEPAKKGFDMPEINRGAILNAIVIPMRPASHTRK